MTSENKDMVRLLANSIIDKHVVADSGGFAYCRYCYTESDLDAEINV